MNVRLVILGATGSVGKSAWKVWEQHRERIPVEGLVAHRQGDRLWQMGQAMGARWIALTDEQAARALAAARAGERGPRIVAGRDAMLEQLQVADMTHVLAAMSGFTGLEPALLALQRGCRLLLANKETMVAAGDLVRTTASQYGGVIVPVDSEHSAIFQCLNQEQPVRRLILTCSGGPFRGWRRADLENVTVDEALRHPNWSMGPKITVDSATLMNKGLELIEAHQLFGVNYDRIDVVVHPESVVHSMVEYADGAVMAQCGHPDMQVPIEVALAWPERWPLALPAFDWIGRTLHFEDPDLVSFPALGLAREAGTAGGLLPAVLNAANEVAVGAFLTSHIRFLDIADVVAETMAHYQPSGEVTHVDEVLAADAWARRQASHLITTR